MILNGQEYTNEDHQVGDQVFYHISAHGHSHDGRIIAIRADGSLDVDYVYNGHTKEYVRGLSPRWWYRKVCSNPLEVL